MNQLIEKLSTLRCLEIKEFEQLISACVKCDDSFNQLRDKATQVAREQFGCGVYMRGLVEISSYCKNNCYYCGLRRDNRNASRYRLSDGEILSTCIEGYEVGLRTFVLQGGEDAAFTDSRLANLIAQIRHNCPDAVVTLSLGERSKESYQRLFDAGASRYLLRHEAASQSLYEQIHPSDMSYDNRINCIKSLAEIGYQTGMGMMVGVPGQTIEHLINDILLMSELRPKMIGIGTFISHPHTPLGIHTSGDLRLTYIIIAIARLMHPQAYIPATTALQTLSATGYIDGILSGANVVMPNITPLTVRPKYEIYKGKHHTTTPIAETIQSLAQQLSAIGYHL